MFGAEPYYANEPADMTIVYRLSHCEYTSPYFLFYSSFFAWENTFLYPDGDVFTEFLFQVDGIRTDREFEDAIHMMHDYYNHFLEFEKRNQDAEPRAKNNA